jgi:hypothetical protein
MHLSVGLKQQIYDGEHGCSLFGGNDQIVFIAGIRIKK